MSKHDVLEGEGELEAAWNLNERGAQPAGGSVARTGPSGTGCLKKPSFGNIMDMMGVKVFGKKYIFLPATLASEFGILVIGTRYLTAQN